ncbi:MAG: nucleoside phosphorylase [Gemmatimonadetes bacterium]|nr:nucleoside phosphorylase [Gemmatimonadota bacterium]
MAVRDLSPVALVVGDPKRAIDAAERLEGGREIGSNREYLTLTGTIDGQRVTVCSHGVGAAGANVCFTELLQGGVTAFIRAGSCGALTRELSDGDLVVADAAVREDAATEHLVPLAYPATPDRGLTGRLTDAAARRGVPAREGLIVTDANFYPGLNGPRWAPYPELGAIAVEMELAALFVLARSRGARAAGILTVDGNLVTDRDPAHSDYDPHREVVARGISTMLDVAVEAAGSITAEPPT